MAKSASKIPVKMWPLLLTLSQSGIKPAEMARELDVGVASVSKALKQAKGVDAKPARIDIAPESMLLQLARLRDEINRKEASDTPIGRQAPSSTARRAGSGHSAARNGAGTTSRQASSEEAAGGQIDPESLFRKPTEEEASAARAAPREAPGGENEIDARKIFGSQGGAPESGRSRGRKYRQGAVFDKVEVRGTKGSRAVRPLTPFEISQKKPAVTAPSPSHGNLPYGRHASAGRPDTSRSNPSAANSLPSLPQMPKARRTDNAHDETRGGARSPRSREDALLLMIDNGRDAGRDRSGDDLEAQLELFSNSVSARSLFGQEIAGLARYLSLLVRYNRDPSDVVMIPSLVDMGEGARKAITEINMKLNLANESRMEKAGA